jgi:hypothetical protein
MMGGAKAKASIMHQPTQIYRIFTGVDHTSLARRGTRRAVVGFRYSSHARPASSIRLAGFPHNP